MTRRAFTLAPLAVLPILRADERTDILDIVTPLAASLAAGDALGFLDGFDRKMPGFADLSGWATALVETFEVTSSVDLIEVKGDDVMLDWEMRLRSRIPTAESIDRRQTITVRIDKRKKIAFLRPLEFFKA